MEHARFRCATAVAAVLLLTGLACDSGPDAGAENTSVPVRLTEPEDGAETADAIRFSWIGSASSGWFRLQVALDSSFVNIVSDVNSGTVPRHIVRDLERNQTHFWRVRREHDRGVDAWSPVRTFKPVSVALLPGRPNLVEPVDLAGGLPREVTVAWQPVPEAISYHLQVFMDEDLLLFHADLDELTGTEFDILDLVYTYPYWWRVRAESVGGVGPWSPVWKFQVEDGE